MIRSAGVVVVRQVEGEWRYLFLRAYRNWDFPKGLPASGEDPMETAQREVEEETGIKDLDFRWGGIFKETEPYSGRGKIARYYLAETSQPNVIFSVNPEIGRPEHHEYRWETYEKIMQLAPPRLQPIIEWAHVIISGG
jgi:bis(5'-nucleosidyl)-tetraphosphatase